MTHYLTDNMLRSTKMTIYDFASGVTMHGFNHVFVKDMDVQTNGSLQDHDHAVPSFTVIWSGPDIHG